METAIFDRPLQLLKVVEILDDGTAVVIHANLLLACEIKVMVEMWVVMFLAASTVGTSAAICGAHELRQQMLILLEGTRRLLAL